MTVYRDPTAAGEYRRLIGELEAVKHKLQDKTFEARLGGLTAEMVTAIDVEPL